MQINTYINMKRFILASLILGLVSLPTTTKAGDCTKRTEVDWHATISSAVNVRNNCPTGDVVGVVPGGEVVEILEVDNHRDFYLIKTSVGTGFVYNSFLKDIKESPLAETQSEPQEDSIFVDLNLDHPYYQEIEDVKERGIVGGTPEGKILADNKVNRAELAKILVEATTDDETIEYSSLSATRYSDADHKAWYAKYLEVARIRNIMTGDKVEGSKPKTVRPGDFANGAEVAKMIAVAFNLDIREPTEIEQWYTPYLDALFDLNALPYDKADHKVTRGEMMFMISKILESQNQ